MSDQGFRPSEEGFASGHRCAPDERADDASSRKRLVNILRVLLVAFVCVALAAAGYLVWQKLELDRSARQAAETPRPLDSSGAQAQSSESPDGVENPVDFAALKMRNPDIYAWVSIPGTEVNTPILQSVVDDNYYLDHNADGDYAIEGAAYTQRVNATDFSDPVTLVYGHQVENGTIFTTLHRFENKQFFDENETMYIYTQDRILTYEIVAAYQYDDRHIMNSFDFSDSAVLREYFDSVLDPASMLVNVREGAQLADGDRIVQLSTCMDAVDRDNTRYLVTGVLVDEQKAY